MSNMSYCRFQNTVQDLRDCKEALEELEELGGVDEYGEKLSQAEERAKKNLIELCEEITEAFGRE